MLIEFAAAPGGEVLDLGRGQPGALLDRVRLDVAAGRASPWRVQAECEYHFPSQLCA